MSQRWLRYGLRCVALGSLGILSSEAASAGNGPNYPTTRELVEVRSIGDLSISSDGKTVAFRVLAPSIAEDRTTAQWSALALASNSEPIRLGRASVPLYVPLYDLIDDSKAVWGSDSLSIYVRQVGSDGVQIHQLGLDGSDRQLTHDEADVSTLSATSDGAGLSYTVHNSRSEIERLQREEEQRGIRLDQSVPTEGLRLSRNFLIGDRATSIRWSQTGFAAEAYLGAEHRRTVPLGAGSVANNFSGLLLDASLSSDLDRDIRIPRTSIVVRLHAERPTGRFLTEPRLQIIARLPTGDARSCDLAICRGEAGAIRSIAVAPSSSDVLIFRVDDFSARTKVYAWNPASGRARLVLDPQASLDGGSSYTGRSCVGSVLGPVCVLSGATIAPRLVRVDPVTGRMVVLTDPNRGFEHHDFGEVKYLAWKDSAGRSANGILVYPHGQKGPFPLVITTYRCRGLLRGGLTNLAPEFPLASLGIASICVNNNNANALDPGVEDGSKPLYAHKAAVESYRAIIDKLANEGLIDRSRVGIAGHSFSANAAAYGISHTDLFAAAVLGGAITIDPATFMLSQPTVPSTRSSLLDFLGLPAPDNDPRGLWRANSPALNASSIRAPLLIEAPESEYLDDLQLFSAVQHAGGITDMFVFPREGHMVGRSPAHQYWRSARAVAWFAFWLRGLADESASSNDVRHWRELKDRSIARDPADVVHPFANPR